MMKMKNLFKESKGKIILLLLSSILISQVFTSCKSTNAENDQPSSQKPNVIRLSGNPTTGYTWSYAVEPEGIISIEENEVYRGEGNIVGAPSDFFYTITGLSDGTATIHFSYNRPWLEGEVEPIGRQTWQATVKNGNVTLSQIE